LKQLKSGNLAPEGFLQQEMLQSKLTETHLPSTLFPYKNRFFRSYIETIIKEQKPGSNRFSQQEMLQSKLTTKTSHLYNSFPHENHLFQGYIATIKDRKPGTGWILATRNTSI
jgi:hypothetical protein